MKNLPELLVGHQVVVREDRFVLLDSSGEVVFGVQAELSDDPTLFDVGTVVLERDDDGNPVRAVQII